MKVEFLGHSCFLIADTNDCRILIDPFLSGNGLGSRAADEVHADYIFVTHNHGDHVGDALAIAKRTGARVYGVVELVETVFVPAGVSVGMGNIGGRQATTFGSVKYVPALHSSGVPGGQACGYLFEIDGKRIYHAGDTAVTRDMELLAAEMVDLALLPIGDVFTMGLEDAVQAASMIRPKRVIPMHYNTFPPIKQRPELFKQMVESQGICEVAILSPGESLEI